MCAAVFSFSAYFYYFLAAIYTVYTSPNHPSVPNHLPTLIVTPHGTSQPDFCDHTARSDAFLDWQGNLQISSTRTFTRTLYAPASKTALEARSNNPLRNRTRRTTCSRPLPKVIYVLLSSSRPAAPAPENPLLRILVILVEAPESFVAKHPETSSGQSPTQAYSHPFTSSPSPLRIPQIFLYFKSLSRTQMLRSGACSILPMRDTTSHLSELNSERSRRIHPRPTEQEVGEPGSVSPGGLQKRRRCGRLLEKATRIVWNGWSCAQLSTSSSRSQPLAL